MRHALPPYRAGWWCSASELNSSLDPASKEGTWTGAPPSHLHKLWPWILGSSFAMAASGVKLVVARNTFRHGSRLFLLALFSLFPSQHELAVSALSFPLSDLLPPASRFLSSNP